ncbi:hypothetical protein Val02_59490 [Virgisporangium aliadipatigenens]|uniref:Uncharacterized protein n=1 Tax=Virgisporangium aliadipatigenens TaxID=741659 RepID=A0A8J4DTJ6_9ACTN|nr:hypothetical protein [Virgisporangium aliadipatigenens]GIJ49063.1 hypothetical protein Val02_59490 [Virgisporangium aliadipatigenens]
MSGYTLTITPHDDSSGAHTTIQVDTAGGTPRITELLIRPAAGQGLTPHQLPSIDLAGLMAALSPAAPAVTAAADTVTPTEVLPPRRARRPRAAAEPEAERPRRGRRSRAAEEATVVEAKPTPRRRGRGRAKAAEPVEEARTSRAYRRMPDPDEVVAAWEQTGKVSALAEHFDVPRHTATGWLRRLRGLGLIEAR